MSNKSEFNFKTTFPPLGHPEHHFNKYPDHPWLKTEKEVLKWLKKYDRDYKYNKINYKINEDLTVSLDRYTVDLSNNVLTNIPIQFRKAFVLNVNDNKLESLLGTPYLVSSLFANSNRIESFLGIHEINIRLELTDNKIKDFKNMPKFESSIFIDLDNNPIESWEGFTNCDNLWWWQAKWCNETSYNLLINTPKSINRLCVLKEFISDKIVKENNLNIDMVWLRDAQKSYYINNTIKNTLNKEEKNKKRKL